MSNEKSEQDCRTTEVSKRIIRLFDYMESSGYMPSDMVYVIRRLICRKTCPQFLEEH